MKMKSFLNDESNNIIPKKKLKKKFLVSKEDNNNYVIFSKGTFLYTDKVENQHEYSDYKKIYIKKKNNYNNILNNDETEIQNSFNKLNEEFENQENDRNSLILQISGTESIKEIQYKKNKKKLQSPSHRIKTPEKKLKDIKKNAKERKYHQRNQNKNTDINKLNDNNINNINNTATFNEDNKMDRKYEEFSFNNDDKYTNNNNGKILDDKRNGGKVDLFDKKEIIQKEKEIISKNKENHISDDRKKIIKLLKMNKLKTKNKICISKSQDQLNPKEKYNYNENNYNRKTYENIGKINKELIRGIIYDNYSPKNSKKIPFRIKNGKFIDIENSPTLFTHSLDILPQTYQKKIIHKNSNISFKKKKSDIQRPKTEDKYISSLYLNDNGKNNYIFYSNKKPKKNETENNVLENSIGMNYINSSPMNKKMIYSGGNKNIISNYYNNNFYNTPIKNYLEQSSFFIGINNKKSRSLKNSLKHLIDKSKKNKNYNLVNKKENCINLSLSNSIYNLNIKNSFYKSTSMISKIKNKNRYEINNNFTYEYKSPKISKYKNYSKCNNYNNIQFTNIIYKNNVNYKYHLHFSINFEELMIIGEKLYDIIISLIDKKKMANQCFEFWNYFFNSSLPKEIKNLILNSELKDIIYSINYSLMSILICYDYSFDISLIEKSFSLLKENLELIINNYIIFCKYIMKKVSKRNKNTKWILKLNNMLSKNNIYSNIINFNYNKNDEYIINNISTVDKIIYNTNTIINNLNFILRKFKSSSNESLLTLFKKLSQKNYEDINYYYRTFLLREENINGSFLASLYLKDNPNFHSVKAPYITKPNYKKYSLILDLEETLLNFRLKQENKGEGILKLRPGLFEFLEEMSKFYEIILFTASSQDYAETLIDSIEENKKYFSYKFFRQHNIIIENDFVKDLSRIGRDLDKVIIVDNIPQNYRLHKNNGINIKGFWGEDLDDKILLNLKEILIKIAKEGGDLRIGLEKYHEDIVEKITSSIYKFNFE